MIIIMNGWWCYHDVDNNDDEMRETPAIYRYYVIEQGQGNESKKCDFHNSAFNAVMFVLRDRTIE